MDITYSMQCPICDTRVRTFQSKDGYCSLAKVTPHQLLEQVRELEGDEYVSRYGAGMHDSCPGCQAWIQVQVTPRRRDG